MRLHITAVAAACLALSARDLSSQSTIRWEPFAVRGLSSGVTAQLGRLTVPLVRGSGSSATADLAVVRLQSAKRPSGAPIVFLAGGPGQSATSSAGSPSLARLTEIGDVILLDQRGAGMSTPRAVCPAAAPLEPAQKFATGPARLARAVATVKACAEEWGAKGVDARAFTNRESVADIEDLRKALGAPKVSLFGFSYGTHLGLAMLRDFPNSVERAVFVATAGFSDLQKLPSISDVQLAKLSLLAARDPSIGTDVPDMGALLRRVLAKLERQPIMVTVNDAARKREVEIPIGADALRSILVQDLGDGTDFIVFPALFLTIERGDPSILAWFAEKRYNQISGGTDLMPLAMRCSAGRTEARERERRVEAAASPFGNWVNFPYPDVCAVLPPVDHGESYRSPLVSDVPVLFISGTLDNNTPPFQAEQLRWGMPRATHLIVLNAGHEDMLPMDAVQAAIADHLAGMDVSNRVIALPPPDFMSVEEAKRDRFRRQGG
jgi:pimeloyl-ACP methyl ester carboxylesterase